MFDTGVESLIDMRQRLSMNYLKGSVIDLESEVYKTVLVIKNPGLGTNLHLRTYSDDLSTLGDRVRNLHYLISMLFYSFYFLQLKF